ncbi:tyrosine-protein kinase TXK-like isoform X1 [Lytechinus variegatus]|uniref:tyrosine-protein kinase TXK-like isoform X1 n=1 Tax=Lytechinus variegatus TaxID=7654 RepID=UPI001BB1D084|nr:tyrosine-protein kinase TXK-like isoform X1 [Lytechinus variegatus]
MSSSGYSTGSFSTGSYSLDSDRGFTFSPHRSKNPSGKKREKLKVMFDLDTESSEDETLEPEELGERFLKVELPNLDTTSVPESCTSGTSVSDGFVTTTDEPNEIYDEANHGTVKRNFYDLYDDVRQFSYDSGISDSGNSSEQRRESYPHIFVSHRHIPEPDYDDLPQGKPKECFDKLPHNLPERDYDDLPQAIRVTQDRFHHVTISRAMSKSKNSANRSERRSLPIQVFLNGHLFLDSSRLPHVRTKRGKEKNRIDLNQIKVVEPVSDGAFQDRQNGIQVTYSEQNNDVTLYFFPASKKEQQEWLHDLRDLVKNNPNLSDRYHYGIWTMSKYTCCQKDYKGAPGCQNTYRTQPQPSYPTTPSNGKRTHGPQQISLPGVPINNQKRPPKPPIPIPNPPVTDRPKMIVIAKYDYEPLEKIDIPLQRGQEYSVLNNSREYWWKVRDKHGREGFIPSNYVEEKSKYSTGLERYDWFNGTWSRQRTELELKQEGKEGCFTVRNSRQPGLCTLSVLAKEKGPGGEDVVRHYHIKQNSHKEFYVSEKHCFRDMAKLIEYHQHNAGGLITRLRNPPGFTLPTTAGLGSTKWEISWSELKILQELGRGQFGVVHLAKLTHNNRFVAVKRMQEGSMSEEDFIDEAKVMKELQHENLVQLYGVTSAQRPMCIVTEYMSKGCLLSYLRTHTYMLLENTSILIYMTQQVCAGMAYLESKHFIHRDLAARNCLVGDKHIVKVADFGLTRYVMDDEYTSSGTKFPIKWAPPEVLHYTRFSSKSDVWAFGILMWEVFSGGLAPYPAMSNVEVVDQVTRHGYRMDRPDHCPYQMYRIMNECWRERPENRPSFNSLTGKLDQLTERTEVHHS